MQKRWISNSSSKKTGEIWQKSPQVRGQIVREVCEALERTYGRPSLGNPKDPLDDLIFIIISNKTQPEMARQVFERIKHRFNGWEDLLATSVSELHTFLKPAGLATVKSEQIWNALEKIKQDLGTLDLNLLRGKPIEEIQDYLVSLPGVSEKVAKCVMMYTLGANVLPVDGHVLRVSKRLGWTARKRVDQCHGELEALIPPKYRFAFHVDCILHGRSICRPTNPICEACCINSYCVYYKTILSRV